MSWREAANQKDSKRTNPRIPEGVHKVKITKALRYKKDGTEMASAKGPYVMLVYENEHGEEATQSVWLTENAKNYLAGTLDALGFDLDRMDKARVDLDQFHDADFCEAQFVGRTAYIEVKHDGKYANAEPIFEHEYKRQATTEHQRPASRTPETYQDAGEPPEAVDEGDIPFDYARHIQ